MNEYGKNSLGTYALNIYVTALFLILYFTSLHLESLYDAQIDLWTKVFVIFIFMCFLYLAFGKPAIKILKGAADYRDMQSVEVIPILGLFRGKWPAYQRMARKLASDKAIKECENILKQMEDGFGGEIRNYLRWFEDLEAGNTTEVLGCMPELPPVKKQDFESRVSNFCNFFRKINHSSKNYKQASQMLHTMICMMIYYRHNELLNEINEKLDGIGNAHFIRSNIDTVECLLYRRERNVLYDEENTVSKTAFRKELEKRVGNLYELLDNFEGKAKLDLLAILNQI